MSSILHSYIQAFFTFCSSLRTQRYILRFGGHTHLVERLVENGADPGVCAEGNNTLLHVAVERAIRTHGMIPGYIRMMGCILLGRKTSVEDTGGGQALEELIDTGYLRIIRYFCALEGSYAPRRNGKGSTPFGMLRGKAWAYLDQPRMLDDISA